MATITVPEGDELCGTVMDDRDDETGRPYGRCLEPGAYAATYQEDEHGRSGWWIIDSEALAIPEDDVPAEWLTT